MAAPRRSTSTSHTRHSQDQTARRRHDTLYFGVTRHLVQRVDQHQIDQELHATLPAALEREKRLKKWNRAWKIELIEKRNPTWRDLYPELVGDNEPFDALKAGAPDVGPP